MTQAHKKATIKGNLWCSWIVLMLDEVVAAW